MHQHFERLLFISLHKISAMGGFDSSHDRADMEENTGKDLGFDFSPAQTVWEQLENPHTQNGEGNARVLWVLEPLNAGPRLYWWLQLYPGSETGWIAGGFRHSYITIQGRCYERGKHTMVISIVCFPLSASVLSWQGHLLQRTRSCWSGSFNRLTERWVKLSICAEEFAEFLKEGGGYGLIFLGNESHDGLSKVFRHEGFLPMGWASRVRGKGAQSCSNGEWTSPSVVLEIGREKEGEASRDVR